MRASKKCIHVFTVAGHYAGHVLRLRAVQQPYFPMSLSDEGTRIGRDHKSACLHEHEATAWAERQNHKDRTELHGTANTGTSFDSSNSAKQQ